MARLSRFALASALASGMLLAASSVAFADYGKTAVYQVEISANGSGAQFGGGGAWLWIELDGSSTTSGGTGTYAGSDCGHAGSTGGGGGATSDKGDVTWTSDGTTLTITGVMFNGVGGVPVTVKVPAAFGNTRETIQEVFGLPFPGWAQVQVAP